MKNGVMIMLAAAASCGLLFYAFWSAGPEAAPAKVTPEKVKQAAVASPAPATNTSGAGSPAGASLTTATLPASPQPEAAMTADGAKQKALEEIQLASISYDPAELPKMQPYLLHSDPEIREAALNGFVVLGDAKGAPLLRNAARQLTDPKEAVKYLEKADWLELPSIPPEIIKSRLLKKKAGSTAKPGAVAPTPK